MVDWFRTDKLNPSRGNGYDALSVLRDNFRRELYLVLPSEIYLDWSELLLMGLLDCTLEYSCESVIWDCEWARPHQLRDGILDFDWTQVSAWNGSPIAIPWWAQCHLFLGFVFFYWILLPILYYTNACEFSYFPILSSFPYDRYGQLCDIQRSSHPRSR